MEAVFNERFLKFLLSVLGIGGKRILTGLRLIPSSSFLELFFFPSLNDVESSYKVINSHIIKVILWLSTILTSHNPK